MASEGLFRIGFASDVIVFLCDVAVAVLLYMLLRPVSRTLSLMAAAFRLVGTAIYGANLLNQFAALHVLTGGDGGLIRQGVLDEFITTELERAVDDIAAGLDATAKAGEPRGPLHGVPVLIKDNINTGDRMHTSAGSLVLAYGLQEEAQQVRVLIPHPGNPSLREQAVDLGQCVN